MKTIEVVFSPALYTFKQTNENFIAVIIDVLRATTSMVAAFQYGVKQIIPVSDLVIARDYKSKGYLVAAERDGKCLDFADYGNSPFDYMNEGVLGKTIVYSTTNGTRAINLTNDSQQSVIAAFTNFSAVIHWLIEQDRNVVILCAGWKNMFNLEDSVCAGMITDKLIQSGRFHTSDDAAKASMAMSNVALKNLPAFIEQASHRARLKLLGVDDSLEYCLTVDKAKVVPGIRGGVLVDLLKIS